jgi:hypothetical protein
VDMIQVEGKVVLKVPDIFRIVYIEGKALYTYYKRLQVF